MNLKGLLLLSFAILLVSCSVNVLNENKLQRLDEHLKTWEKFRFDGIIKINHKNLSLHKYFTLRKEEDVARLDIYDSGLLGMKPNPFISVYYDSLIQARVPDSAEIKVLKPEDYPDYFSYFLLFQTLAELQTEKAQIIKNSSYDNGEQTFFFDEQQRLEKVIFNNDTTEVLIRYKTNIQEIIIIKGLDEIASLVIDEVNYDFKKISPLIK